MIATEILQSQTVYIHVVSGSISLLAGLTSVFARKGQKLHRLCGRIFFLSMLLVCISAFISVVYSGNLLMLMLGVFTLFQLFSGFRAVHPFWKERIWPGIALLATGLICSILMAATGSVVLIIFACLCLTMTYRQFVYEKQLWKNNKPNAVMALSIHLTGMVAALISALTAFLVNTRFGSGMLIWLLPSMVLVPVIVYWIRKLNKRLSRNGIEARIV